MSEKNEALRLADLLEDKYGVDGYVHDEAAAELRRLHAECNDLAHQLNESNERNGRLRAERDALLEALTQIAGYNLPDETAIVEVAHAAIKAVEEGK